LADMPTNAAMSKALLHGWAGLCVRRRGPAAD
jgi:hypothetical protein